MKLYLIQHGEACKKNVDPERPLTEKGRKDVDLLGAFLKQADIQVDRVIHSGKLRAMQTAEQLSEAIAPGVGLEVSALINPNGDPKMFDPQSDGGGKDMLVVGHLPFLAKLVSHLTIGDQERLFIAYQPGSVVCLEAINGSRWQVDWMIRPELLHTSVRAENR